MSEQQGDQAFRNESPLGRWEEMTYGGALSFLRRRYTREIAGADIVVSGVPYDAAVTYRPGCRLGPRAIRLIRCCGLRPVSTARSHWFSLMRTVIPGLTMGARWITGPCLRVR